MNLLLAVVILYPMILLGVSLWRSRGVKSHDDFMVAGRAVPVPLLVGTLVCTWIGSGSLFGGAGLAYRTGIAELWFSLGGWLGLIVAFFLAARVRRIAEYTVPDLLEKRYNAMARVLGTIAIILAYVTIAAYQFRGGGWILSIVSDGAISPDTGMYITAIVIVLFTGAAGMVSIVTVDVFNGIIITLGVLFALPYMVFELGGVGAVTSALPAQHLEPLGGHNVLWVFGVAAPTFLLILGESGMYQKFFSAKNESAARKAVVGMVIGIVIIEVAIALLAIVGRAAFPDLMESTSIVGPCSPPRSRSCSRRATHSFSSRRRTSAAICTSASSTPKPPSRECCSCSGSPSPPSESSPCCSSRSSTRSWRWPCTPTRWWEPA
jgi:SSS family solute:Na+ symporter/sodium/proline symporter